MCLKEARMDEANLMARQSMGGRSRLARFLSCDGWCEWLLFAVA